MGNLADQNRFYWSNYEINGQWLSVISSIEYVNVTNMALICKVANVVLSPYKPLISICHGSIWINHHSLSFIVSQEVTSPISESAEGYFQSTGIELEQDDKKTVSSITKEIGTCSHRYTMCHCRAVLLMVQHWLLELEVHKFWRRYGILNIAV